ncbi:putative linocin/CFP29 family protein [Paraburkholderia sp. WC7.3g]|uniref:encapsulin n=1 Tax=Paraburkholderia sp. WC7.3g TaxID=2991070 RepID=UPI003D1A09F3
MSNNEINWSPEVWASINGTDQTNPGLLKTVMGPMRVAQHVFNTTVQGTEDSIHADTVDLKTGIPTTGQMKSFATLIKSFVLFPVHVGDSKLTMAMNQVTLAAQSLALVEDMLYFQGQKAKAILPKQVSMPDKDIEKLGDGLLGIAESNLTIQVALSNENNKTYGAQTFAAVVKGISFFTKNLQGPPYALILEPAVYADTNVPLEDSSLITPASAIRPLLETGGFVMTPGLPQKTGLLVSLGGQTTTLYVGTAPAVACKFATDNSYSFTASESIQFHNIDPRSLVKLEFTDDKSDRNGATTAPATATATATGNKIT